MTGARPRVLIVSIGGTITMTRDATGGIVPTLTAADLVGAVPAIDAVAAVETVSPLRKPGPSLTLDDLMAVADLLRGRLARDVDGAVVIQGTDTIEETAFVLDCLLGGDKPVVVTGAMRGPEAAGADGPANLLAAAIVAGHEAARGRGVLVVLNDEVHAARSVQKTHTALASTFGSPGRGPVGLVSEGTVRFHARTDRLAPIEGPFGPDDKPVALLTMCLGDDGRLLPELPRLGFAGLVIQGTGVGHVPAAVAPLASDLLAFMPVVLSSRVAAGPVFTSTYGYPGSEMDLIGRGLLPSGGLSGLKARLLLMLLLRSGLSGDALSRRFQAFA